MAEQYRFFGSAEGDTRQYNQTEFAEVLSRLLKNGYFPEVDNELEVEASDPVDMTVEVSPGQAWINGYWYKNDAEKVLTINSAHATLNRIDRVVLRLDIVNDRKIEAVVIQGTPASNPAAPALTRTSQIYEISLAQIYVAAGVTSISQSAITDERDDINVCGKAVPYYVPTNDDISNTAEPNKILKLNANAKLPASITGDANSVGGKTYTDLKNEFSSAQKVYGKNSFNITLAPNQTKTEYINLPSNIYKNGMAVHKNCMIFFSNNNLETKVVGYIYYPHVSVGAWTRRERGFVTYDSGSGSIRYGSNVVISTQDLYIDNDKIVIIFKNNYDEEKTTTLTFDWEVW